MHVESKSLETCTCGGLYYSIEVIANGFHPTTHKVNLQASKAIILPKTKASGHSHHLGQFALLETHWPFRVSGCGPYLNPYPNIYTTHHHGVSPRDSWNYAYHTIRIIFIIQFHFPYYLHPILMLRHHKATNPWSTSYQACQFHS